MMVHRISENISEKKSKIKKRLIENKTLIKKMSMLRVHAYAG